MGHVGGNILARSCEVWKIKGLCWTSVSTEANTERATIIVGLDRARGGKSAVMAVGSEFCRQRITKALRRMARRDDQHGQREAVLRA